MNITQISEGALDQVRAHGTSSDRADYYMGFFFAVLFLVHQLLTPMGILAVSSSNAIDLIIYARTNSPRRATRHSSGNLDTASPCVLLVRPPEHGPSLGVVPACRALGLAGHDGSPKGLVEGNGKRLGAGRGSALVLGLLAG